MNINKDLNEFKIFVRVENKILIECIDDTTIDIFGGIECEDLSLKLSIIEIMKSQYNIDIHKELLMYLGTDNHEISYYFTILNSTPNCHSLGLNEFLNSNISLITRNFIEDNYNKIDFYVNSTIDEVIVANTGSLLRLYRGYRSDLINELSENSKKFNKKKNSIILKSSDMLNKLIPWCSKIRTKNFIKDKINKINKFLEI